MLTARPSSVARQCAWRDVDALVGERLRDVREQARLVGAQDLDRDLVLRLRLAVPLDVDAALGIEVEALVAVAAVDGDAAAAGDEADDRIARERASSTCAKRTRMSSSPGDLDAGRRRAPRDLARAASCSMRSGLARGLGLRPSCARPGSACSTTCCAVILP